MDVARFALPRPLLLLFLTGLLTVRSLGGEDVVDWEGIRFRTFTCAPEKVEIFWRDASGRPWHQIARLQEGLAAEGRRLRFAMNGGIFEEGGIPSGLLVIRGREERPLNVAAGQGNFYLSPNGVFFTDERGAHVVSTAAYHAERPSPRYAVQSGPLLLEDGRRHPAFRAESAHRLHRNGVGILPDGRVLFVITEFRQTKRPNLYEFAEFFRSRGCRDALFLDGDISQMEVDPKGPLPPGNHFGSILAVTE